MDALRANRVRSDQATLSGLPSFHVETKKKDPRYAWYRERYGLRCWELDALSPVILRDRIERAIRKAGRWSATTPMKRSPARC